jgi:adenosylmethionine-8-amino-7-oxononanoate aminotransferase
MANPLACAAANASLDLFETEPRLEQARAIERQLTEELSACRDVPEVVDVRCRGAIGVIEVTELHDVNALRADLVRRGVWLRPFGNMIYMTPPLTIRSEPLSELTRATVEAVRASSRRALVG